MIVQAPDNKTIDFGNMPPDQVQSAMQKMYPPIHQQMVNQDVQSMSENGPSIPGIPNTQGVPARLGAYGLNALQTIPFSDEAISGVGAAFGGGQGQDFGARYTDLQQRQQAMREAGQQLNPYATMAGQLSGGLALAPLMPSFGAGKTIARSIGSGMLTGTGYGAAYGAGQGDAFQQSADSLDTRLQNAKTGAEAGGILGGILPLAGAYVGKSLRAQPSEKLAAGNIADVLSKDNIDLSQIPPDLNILQAGGNAATARAEGIAIRGNAGANLLSNYAVNEKTALPQNLSEALGKPFQENNYPAILDAIKQKAKQEAGPAYDAAYNAVTKINDPEINQILDRAVNAGDWPVLTSEANKLAAYEGKTLGNIDATGMARSYSTQDLDYMTRALRNLGQGTEGMGAFGNMTPLGGMRANAAGIIRDRLKQLNPLFGQATEQYAGDIAMHDAAQMGKSANLFGGNWKQSVFDYKNLSPSEQMAWRTGQAENLQTMIANNPGTALSRMNSPQFSKVMQNFYPPDEYASLMGSVNQLAKNSSQIRQITGNSRTAQRALQQASDNADPRLDVAEAVIKNGPIKATKDYLIDKLIGSFSNRPTRQAADTDVARILLSSPFQLSSQQTGGFMKPMMQQAITGNPLVDNILQGQLNRNNLAGRSAQPLINYMFAGPGDNQQ